MSSSNQAPPAAATPGDLGSRVREERERLGLSQAALGEILDHTGAWVYGVERGRHSPSPTDLQGLASTLHVTVEWLVSGQSATSAFISTMRAIEGELDERARRSVLALAQDEADSLARTHREQARRNDPA